ncbi:DUF4350 domain-containing protein [Synechococcales cyanobacterium C]|uniref:DUF4350 domain-containing protein n=1 Tax=Petrachloros mirabilis ULC683 TaxID=2781853 RepID=A0A8K2A1H5_9CYAN|nr:DUF4350 domain-containing protein [Petrachloros mirabilis]NCJ07931.1 DUF4350 domain-containing protein [Petrachloros mirabilis ULC683]
MSPTLSAPPPTPVPPSPATRRGSRWLWLGLILAGGMALAVLFFSAPQPQGGSTYGRGLTGYRAWYEFALAQDISVQRWQRPYDQLSGTGQALLQVWGETPVNPPTSSAESALRDWVKAGNTVIRFTWAGQLTAAPFNSQVPSPEGAVQVETTRRMVSPADGVQRQLELQDSYGAVVWSERHGQGSMVFATYPWLAANIYADQPGNYELLTQLVQRQSGNLWVDEWVHGHRDELADDSPLSQDSAPTVFAYLAQTPLGVVAGQILVILALLLWTGNHRFGQVWRPIVKASNNSETYIQSLAATLNAAGHSAFVIEQLQDWVRQQLADQLGLMAPGSGQSVLPDDPTLAQAWGQATGRPPQDLLNFLKPSRQTQRLRDRDFLAWLSRAESLLRGQF